jgi:hypothetical protein
VHLSAREVQAITAIAERQAALTGFSAVQLGEMLLRALPVFKGCQRAGMQAARVHCREWRQWGGPAYARLRDALGLFTPTTGYVAQSTLRESGRNPADAFARNWAADFAFDPAPVRAPIRRLGASWRAAKLAAERAAARQAKAASSAHPPASASPVAPRDPAIEPTARIYSQIRPPSDHIQTPLRRAAPTPTGRDPDLVLDPLDLCCDLPRTEPTGDVDDSPLPLPLPSAITSPVADRPLFLPFGSALGSPVTGEIRAPRRAVASSRSRWRDLPSACRSRSARAAPRRSSDPDP